MPTIKHELWWSYEEKKENTARLTRNCSRFDINIEKCFVAKTFFFRNRLQSLTILCGHVNIFIVISVFVIRIIPEQDEEKKTLAFVVSFTRLFLWRQFKVQSAIFNNRRQQWHVSEDLRLFDCDESLIASGDRLHRFTVSSVWFAEELFILLRAS